jgi:4-amino-4-deoxy-L-arabinose transferase-like glycosyltransferase
MRRLPRVDEDRESGNRYPHRMITSGTRPPLRLQIARALKMIREDDREQTRLVVSAVAAASVVVNLTLLALLGVRRGVDTGRYEAAASDLLAGRLFRGPAGWVYLGYNGLLAIAEAVGAGQLGVIAFQFLAAACAAMALYDLGRDIGGRWVGLLAAGFFVLDYDIARWHLYLLTDSAYLSLVVIATWAAHQAVGRSAGAYLAASAVALLTALIRPNGWVMIPIVATYWIIRSAMRNAVKVAAAAALLIVCGVGVAAFAAVQFGRAAPPPRVLGAGQVNVQRLPFARVMTIRDRLNPARMPMRLLEELGHLRREFSVRHKVFVVAMLTAVYPLAIYGFARSRGQPVARLMATVVACHLMVVTITFSDRDGRYLLYIFPFLVVFAARGAVDVIRR